MKALRILLITLLLGANLFAQKKNFTIEEIFSGYNFREKTLSGVEWYNGGRTFSFLKMDRETYSMSIFKHDVESGEEKLIVSGNFFSLYNDGNPLQIGYYKWSPDNNNILITSFSHRRYSKPGGDIFIYDVNDQSVKYIPEGNNEQWVPAFSPDSKKIRYYLW